MGAGAAQPAVADSPAVQSGCAGTGLAAERWMTMLQALLEAVLTPVIGAAPHERTA